MLIDTNFDMTRNAKLILFVTALMSVLSGCKDVPTQTVVPLYKTIAEYNSMMPEARDSVLETDEKELKALLDVLGFNKLNDTALSEWASSVPVAIFTPDVDSVYPTLKSLEKSLGGILANADSENLELPQLSYVAVVWGSSKSIVFADSCMLIALNHYLGSDYPGYSHWPRYMQMDKTPARLPYDIAEYLVKNKYPYQPVANSTALSRMIYEGAVTLAKMRLVENPSLAEALGYNQEQIEWFEEKHEEMWSKLVGANMIYDTSYMTINRLVNPSPAITIGSSYLPARAGRYIGYEIVCEYLEHEELPLRELLSPDFYNSDYTLIKSQYTAD